MDNNSGQCVILPLLVADLFVCELKQKLRIFAVSLSYNIQEKERVKSKESIRIVTNSLAVRAYVFNSGSNQPNYNNSKMIDTY